MSEETAPRGLDSETPEALAATGQVEGDPRNPNQKARPPRIPLRHGANLNYPEEKLDKDNFAYYWFLDMASKPGRIQSAHSAYWEHVEENGKPVTRKAGENTHYLMKLPIEYYNEDQARKAADVARTMAENMKLGRNEYAPDAKGNPEGGTCTRQTTYREC